MNNPLKKSSKAKYIHERLEDPKKFDPRSFRTKSVSPRTKLIVGCPKKKWSPKIKRCKVGMKTQAILKLKPEYIRQNCPIKQLMKNAVLIGKQVTAIEYYDPEKAKREGFDKPHTIWRHDFKTTGAKIYGLPDGSVLIKKHKKPLWEWR